jgi:hypothetical protein
MHEALVRVRLFLNHNQTKDRPKDPSAFRSVRVKVSICKNDFIHKFQDPIKSTLWLYYAAPHVIALHFLLLPDISCAK